MTITILDISHDPVFYVEHNVLETGFCLYLQVHPAQLGPVDGTGLRTQAVVPVGFVLYWLYKTYGIVADVYRWRLALSVGSS
jgi:hypothetical protein